MHVVGIRLGIPRPDENPFFFDQLFQPGAIIGIDRKKVLHDRHLPVKVIAGISREEKTVGSTSLLLGVIGISEGAIPFILKNPRLIPVFMTGAVAGALVAIALGVKQTLPLPAIWGWPLATNVAGYLASVFIGALICALGVLYVSPKNVR